MPLIRTYYKFNKTELGTYKLLLGLLHIDKCNLTMKSSNDLY